LETLPPEIASRLEKLKEMDASLLDCSGLGETSA
jgi:hypothetical protein